MSLDLRLRAYNPNNSSLGLLPAPDSYSLAVPLNDSPSLSLNYGVSGPRSDLLGKPLELAVEVSGDGGLTWVEPDDCRFLYLRDGRDPIKTADTWQAEAPGYIWRLSKARILAEGKADANGQRVFSSVTVGSLLATLWNEATARGALAGMTLSGSATVDAAGAAWGATLSRSYDLGQDYLSVLQELADAGQVDYRMTGRTLKLYKPDTAMATDRTTGANQVALTPLIITEAPFRRTWEGLADFIQVVGDEASAVALTNPAALKPWGRWEDFITQGGVKDTGTLTALGQRYQSLTADARAEFTQGLALASGPRPLLDFKPGDYVWSRVLDGTQTRYRVRQVTLQKDGATVQGNVVLNDRFLEADIRAKRAMDRITGGASASGSTGGTPTLPGADILAPSTPARPTVSSAAYLDETGTARAQVTVDWSDVTTNADGTTLTDLDHYEVQAAPGAAPTASQWQAVQRTGGTDSLLTLSPYPPGSVWSFRVRAVDAHTNWSDWSPAQSVTMATDTTGPSKPSTPGASARLGVVEMTWDGKTATGGTMELDLARVEVHSSNVSGFTPTPGDAATLVGNLSTAGRILQGGLPYDTTRYVRLVALDRSGNASTPSDQATVTVTPLVNGDAANLVIQAGQIASNAVKADNIEAGAITGLLVSGDIIQTDTAASRGIKLDGTANTLRAYSSSGALTFDVNGSTGAVSIAGTFKTSTSGTGKRIELQTSGQVAIYSGNTSETSPGLLYSAVGGPNNAYGDTYLYSPVTSSPAPPRAYVRLTDTGLGQSYAWLSAEDVYLNGNTHAYGTLVTDSKITVSAGGIDVTGNVYLRGSSGIDFGHGGQVVQRMNFGTTGVTVNSSGYIVLNHGLGAVPDAMVVIGASHFAAGHIFKYDRASSTSAAARIYALNDAGNALPAGGYTVSWIALQ